MRNVRDPEKILNNFKTLYNLICSEYAISFSFQSSKNVLLGSVCLSRKASAFPLLIYKCLKGTDSHQAPFLCVRGWAAPQIFPYFQGDMVTCCHIMGASKRCQTPGSVTKDFITHSQSKSNSQSFTFVFVGSPVYHRSRPAKIDK